ncbi:uncharacterized protein RAG0_12324 [Rhynchosporium agropyri]|uniref:Uncharacterized protein n=1 Tax=Rhynchosporium agropyri TaxID=914238 RepID=A0A1E1L8F2_9HELO|nr:uncharacterized protein RAG0_12324 [Rhynchosporium agropyri]
MGQSRQHDALAEIGVGRAISTTLSADVSHKDMKSSPDRLIDTLFFTPFKITRIWSAVGYLKHKTGCYGLAEKPKYQYSHWEVAPPLQFDYYQPDLYLVTAAGQGSAVMGSLSLSPPSHSVCPLSHLCKSLCSRDL